MKTKNSALVLLENGIHFSTVMNMSEKQIKVLSERMKKSENKEQATTPQNTTPITTTSTEYVVKPNSKTMINNIEIDTTGGKTTVTPLKEKEITEKFESKAQQGLFWAKCNNSKGKEKQKWCEMAGEFSKSTSKKQYKKMPEKKHPEKTVKYQKKSTKENYEKELEDMIVEMINNHINPKVTRKNISEKSESMMLRKPKKMSMFSDESGIEMKKMNKPIGKILSMGKSHMDENDTKEKERTKEREKTKTPKRRGNPFKNPNPGVKEDPRGEKEEMKNNFIQWIKHALTK